MKQGYSSGLTGGCQRLCLALLVSGLLSLSACTLFPMQEPMQVYQLPEVTTEAATTAPLDRTLRLAMPRANRTLSSARILVTPQTQQINAYEDARWSDSTPRLLQDYLIEAFRRSGRLSAVVGESSRVSADLELTSDLRAFHIESVNKQPQAVVRLEAQLIQSRQQQVLASRRFEINTTSDGTSVEAAVNALGRATENLSRQMIEWALTHAAE